MARKLELDSSITRDIKAVASDSFSDNIKMISVELIKPCADNFFSMSDIEVLAEDIERQGLKHNLVVSEDKDDKGTYWIKSGHRRFKAICYLIDENRLTSKTVPCYIDGVKTKAENMLDLIMLNATTRVMTDGEVMQQYEVLERTYKELEADGKKFKGRLRERIAEILHCSPSQIGKIETINRYATEEVREAVASGSMSISTANEVAKLDKEEQKELIKSKAPEEIKHKEVKKVQQEKEPTPVINYLPKEDEPEDIDDCDEDDFYSCKVTAPTEKVDFTVPKDNKELINRWANDDSRRSFVNNYRSWGVWLDVPELETKYYRYELPDKSVILAMEYQSKNYYPRANEPEFKTSYSLYHIKAGHKFVPNSVSDSYLSGELMVIKQKLQSGEL